MSRAAVIGLLAALSAAPVQAAETWLPVSLEDPSGGGSVQLRAGAAALHVVLFATWCPPCVEELEALAELEARWGEQGYRLVLVAVATRHTPAKLARFAAQEKPPGRLLLDADGRVERALDGPGLPTHVLIDSRGREVLRTSALDARLRQQVERLVREGFGRRGK